LINKDQYKIRLGLYTLLSIFTACIVVLASVPPVSRDALTHHLYVPKLWLENGNIAPIPEIPFSYYPMNLDLLYLVPLYFGNDIIPKYIHFFFALTTAGLIYWYLKKRLSKNWGLFGALFFLTIPIIVKLSITVYVDLGLMFFTTASLLLLIKWMNSGYQYRYLISAGLFCGLAAGTKYNGLITIFLLTLFVPFIYLRTCKKNKSSTRGAIYGVIFLTCLLFTFSPWLVRNYSLTGNPIYPLYNSLFIGQKSISPPPAKETDNDTVKTKKNIIEKVTSRNSSVFVSRKILYNETWWQTLLLPVRFFFEGKDDTPKFFDGKLTPFLFILPFFAFGRGSPTAHLKREKNLLLAFSLLFFFFTFFQETMRIRYIVSIVPALTLLAILGLHNVTFFISKNITSLKFHHLIIFFIATAMLSYNGSYTMSQFNKIHPIAYIKGNISRDEYIQKYRPEYAAIQYANNNLNKTDKILCIFLGNRGYYMNFLPIFEMPYNGGILTNLTTENITIDIIKHELRAKGIQYILLRNDLTQNWMHYLPELQAHELLQFINSSNLLFQQSGYTLLEISQ